MALTIQGYRTYWKRYAETRNLAEEDLLKAYGLLRVGVKHSAVLKWLGVKGRTIMERNRLNEAMVSLDQHLLSEAGGLKMGYTETFAPPGMGMDQEVMDQALWLRKRMERSLKRNKEWSDEYERT